MSLRIFWYAAQLVALYSVAIVRLLVFAVADHQQLHVGDVAPLPKAQS